MEKDVLISFLVPCYNSEPYMHVCIDSLLKCDTSKIEIIIVNDGSKDNTGKIADEYKDKYPGFITVIHKENGGHGDAINDGIKVAKGKYFKILDSDDWADEEALNRVLNVIENLGNDLPDLFVMNYVYYVGYDNPQKVIRYNTIFKEEEKILTRDKVHFVDLKKNLTLHSCMFRLDVIKESGVVLPKHASYEDNYFVYAGLVHTNTVMYLNNNFYSYLIGRDGQSVSYENCIKRYRDHLLCSYMMNDYFELMSIKKSNKAKYKVLYHYLRLIFMISTIYTRLNPTKEAKLDFKKFIKDTKTNHRKIANKLLYRSFAGLLCLPGWLGGRLLVKLILVIARKVVPFQ